MEAVIESIRDNTFGQSIFLTAGGLIGVFSVLVFFFILIKLLMRVMPKGKD